jgi:hypothetical protein
MSDRRKKGGDRHHGYLTMAISVVVDSIGEAQTFASWAW